MKTNFLLLGALVLTGLIIFYLNSRLISDTSTTSQFETTTQPSPDGTSIANTQKPCVPTFVDGGGPYYKPNSPFRVNMAPEENNGEKLVVQGKVTRQDCETPLADVTLDIWQANESGNYEDEWYRGQIQVEKEGNYRFETVIPKGYGEGTGYRPPHIHFKAFLNGQEVITSQMFLPAAREQQIEEAYIVEIETKEENREIVHYATHNIVLPI